MLAILFSTCDNYEFPASPYPRIETIPISEISQTGVTFRGKITQKGSSAIVDHGFLWGFTPEVDLYNSERLQLGEFTGGQEFAHVVEYGMYKDSLYYMRAYVQTNSYFVFGRVVSFQSGGSSPAVIEDFFPSEATWGDTILLMGKNFSSLADHNHVTFGTLEAEVITSSDSAVACIVPSNFSDKALPISLIAFGHTAHSPREFVAQTPSIAGFSPAMGTFGDIVEITGSEFHKVKEKNVVRFNEHVAEVVEASPLSIKVKVPTGIQTRESEISVTLGAQTGKSAGKFVITPPSIVSLSKDKAFLGETFDIVGTNFNPAIAGNIVKLGGQVATVSYASRELLSVVIPAAGIFDKRSFQVEVMAGGQSAYSAQIITLQDAWLRKQDVPHGRFGRYDAAAFAVDGYGYVGLGSGEVGNKFWRYDPDQNNWTEIAPFPGGVRAAATSFVIDGIAYVGLGSSGLAQSDFWKYDPSTGSWDRLGDFPYATTGAVGLSMNGKGYVATTEEAENFWEYDPATDSWSALGDVPAVGVSDAGFVIGNDIYVYVTDHSTSPNILFKYDFGLRDWYIMAEPEERDLYSITGTTGFALNGFGYIHNPYDLYQYDPALDSWRRDLEGAPGSWELAVSFVIDGKAYIGASSASFQLWEFDPTYLR